MARRPTALDERQTDSFETELKSDVTAREKSESKPTISDVRFGLSEGRRKQFFREYVLIEDRHGVHTSEGKTAKRRLCKEYGITEDQAIEIAVESYKKDWPLP